MQRILKLHIDRFECRQGAAAIEFALLAPVFLIMVFGLIEICLVSWTSITLGRALQAGGKYIIDTRQDMQTPVYNTLKQKICDAITGTSLSCDNLVVAVYAYDDPTGSPVTLPKPLTDVQPAFTADNYVIALGYNWPFSLISTPLLIPKVGGIRQMRRVTYIAAAERPIE
jgi:Flp pilus assembly protein TadG